MTVRINFQALPTDIEEKKMEEESKLDTENQEEKSEGKENEEENEGKDPYKYEVEVFDEQLVVSPEEVPETCEYFKGQVGDKKKIKMSEPLVKWSRTGKVGLKYFSKFLAESECKNLKVLSFKWKDIGSEGILYFGEAIKSGHIPN